MKPAIGTAKGALPVLIVQRPFYSSIRDIPPRLNQLFCAGEAS